MGLVFNIGGVDRTSLVSRKQIGITDELNSRNTYSFSLESTNGSFRPVIGQGISVIKSGVVLFAGTIDEIEEYSPNNGTTAALSFNCQCVDYNQLCDRFTVANAYENQTAGAIIRDIIESFINAMPPGEGVTYIKVEDGPVITKAVFNYVSVTQALDELSELSGYVWYIDYAKDMHFHSRLGNTSPFNLGDTTNNFRNLKVKKTRKDYMNKQYFRGGQDISSSKTEGFKGDGETTTFVLQLPVALVPSNLKVNGVSKTVGIRQVESGKDWYWSKGEREITQDSAGTKLTSSDTLTVTYQGFFPIILENNYDTAIAERKSVEGGSGIYESVVTDQSVDTSQAAQERSDALLRKYGVIPEILEFDTNNDGLKSGQLIQVNISKHNLNCTYLIRSVGISNITDNVLSYHVTALSGENIGGWVDFFKKLAKSGQTYLIRENEVLLKIRRIQEKVQISDSISVSTITPEKRVGYAIVGFSEAG